MIKKLITGIITLTFCAALITGCSDTSNTANPSTSEQTQSNKPEGDTIVAEFEYFDKYGKVLKSVPGDEEVYIESEGYYGYHMEDEPSMTVGVTISKEGEILSVVNVANKDQSEGFAEQITDEYLADVYGGIASSSSLEVAAVSGATATSKAVMYAVQTAAYYAENVYGYVADTSSEEINELNEVFAANYKAVNTNYEVDSKIGTVLYAAEGESSDGAKVLALKVRSANRMNYEGTARTGWDSSEPNPFTMIIVINKDSNKVVAWEMINDGTKKPEYFTVPEESINTYMNVEITSEDIFDNFTDGLITGLDFELEQDPDGNNVIAGTSVVYTGVSEAGTFSGQHIRQCFKTAAYFYSNYQ